MGTITSSIFSRSWYKCEYDASSRIGHSRALEVVLQTSIRKPVQELLNA
jgi:hypothetical protein